MRELRAILIATVTLAAALAFCGCHKPSAPARPVPPPRVVSFSPALTAMTFQSGLGEHVVGVTTRCTLPPGQDRPRVGDRFSVNTESLLSVEPDVLMIQQDPGDFAALVRLRPSVKVEHFDIERLSDVPAAMRRIGTLCGDAAAGDRAAKRFSTRLDQVRQRVKNLPKPRILFVLGFERPGTGGRNSFIHDMIEAAGGVDAAGDFTRWADLNVEGILRLAPEVLVCWVDPGQEAQARERWQSLKGLPAVANGRVYIVSDPDWTIPSAKLADLTDKLADILHGAPASGSAAESRP